MTARSATLQAFRGSPAQRAFLWNTYVVSVAAYPALLAIPTTGLSLGRKPLITYTGNLTLGNVTFPSLPAAYLPILDTSVAGEVAAEEPADADGEETTDAEPTDVVESELEDVVIEDETDDKKKDGK